MTTMETIVGVLPETKPEILPETLPEGAPNDLPILADPMVVALREKADKAEADASFYAGALKAAEHDARRFRAALRALEGEPAKTVTVRVTRKIASPGKCKPFTYRDDSMTVTRLVKALRDAGKPMHYRELDKIVGVSTSVCLSERHNAGVTFERTAPGVYRLKGGAK